MLRSISFPFALGLYVALFSAASAQQTPSVDELADLLTPKLEPQAPVERTRSFRPNDATRGISTITPPTAQSQVVSLTIEFDTGSANLRPDGKEVLDKLALSMNKVKQRTRSAGSRPPVFSMVGHTDHRGDESYNQRLSEQRAEAAKKYLREVWGFTTEEIEAAGRGKSSPRNLNSPCDDRCMQANRRVDVQTR